MKKYLLSIIFITSLLISNLFAQAEITSRLSDALAEASKTNSTVRTLVMLKDQVDIIKLNKQLYETKATLEERAYIVITTLQEKANSTQGSLLSYLGNKYEDEVSEFKSFWITNMVMVEAVPSVILEMAERSDLAVLELDAELKLDEPVSSAPAATKSPNGHEIGLERINATAMWAAGFTGAGRIVMNDDTGVDGNHPALSYKWRGAQPGVPPSAAWFPWNGSGTFPVDGDIHGTHTMGTMCGLDPATNDTIGVAPGAQWIASNALFGNPHTSYSIAAWQWATDPDGDPNTIDDMPDAITNSWYDPNISPANECNPALDPYINAYLGVEATGIAIVFSAGNDGPGAATLTQPKNVNIDEVTFWATGAVDGNNASLPIASFSSRGPVQSACSTGTYLDIKPEASAPGVSVRSSEPGATYGLLSGTSMACPHVAGAIALLREAVPTITGWEAKQALYNTAVDLGDPGEDNTYGMGIIDVYAAYVSLADPTDPNPPSNFTAYSDYNTPTSMLLNWTDPTTYFNGNPLTNFQIYVYRDGSMVGSAAMGAETYTDMGLTDGQSYNYTIYAADIPNDSLSTPVMAGWTAGGSAVPAEPTVFSVTNAGGGDLNANWTAPTLQTDGTPLDDYAGVYLYENGTLLTTISRTSADTGITDTEVFTPSTTNAEYWVTAFDNETPVNESVASNSAYPPYSAPYFEDFEVALALPLLWTNETDDDFDWTVDEGGTTSSSTGPTVDHTLGTAAGNYVYTEASSPNFPNMVAHLTTPTIDISNLPSPGLAFWYHMYGSTMGELHVDVYHNGTWNLDVMTPLVGQQQAAQTDPWLQAIVDLSAYTITPIQIRFRGITGSNFYSDMAIDDVALTSLTNNPLMSVMPTTLGDTLLIGGTDTLTVTVSNTQVLPSSLNFTAVENPAVSWLNVDPNAGVVPSSQSMDLSFAIDATGLTAGTYNTQVVIAGDDTTNPSVAVDVTLVANDAPVISINPDTFYVAIAGANTEVDTMTISNNGSGPLYFTIENRDVTEGLELKVREIRKERKFNTPIAAPKGIRSILPETRTIANESNEFNPVYEDELISVGNTQTISNPYTEDLYYIGSNTTSFSGGDRDRGNFYEITEDVRLREQLYYLDMSTSGDLYHFVYEGSTMSGTYNLISVVQVFNQGPGEQWYNSGPVNVTLYADNYYYIGCAWSVSSTYYTGVGPFSLPFGNHVYGQPSNKAGYPPLASVTGPTTTNVTGYYQALDIATTADWLTIDPDTGTVAAMSSLDVELTFDGTGLNGGDYFAQVDVNSNDPVNPQVSAGVQMHVTGAPGISVNPQNVDFGNVFIGYPDTLSFAVINSGSDSLHVSGMTNSTSEFSILGSTNFVLAIGDSQLVDVIFTSAATGTFLDSVIITSDATNPSPTVYLNAVAVDVPVISLDPPSFDQSLFSNQIITDTLTINNTGTGILNFELMIEDITTVEIIRPEQNNTLTFRASVTDPEQDKVGASLEGVLINNIPEGYPKFLNRTESITPDLMWYKFDETGQTTTQNYAPAPTRVNQFATLMGGMTMGGTGQTGAALIGTGGSSGSDYVDTGWGPDVGTGDWAISLWLNNVDNSATLYYHFGDINTNSFRCFSGGVAGAGNLMLRGGGLADVVVSPVAPGPAVVDFVYDSAIPEVRAYLNGVLNNVVPQSGVDLTGTGPFKIGGYSTSAGMIAGELLDDFKMWNTIPSQLTWLIPDTVSGSIASNSSMDVILTFDANGLVGGDYFSDIVVTSNDPANPSVTANAHLHVIGVADIGATPSPMDWGTIFTNVNDTMYLTIENTGTDTLYVAGITNTDPEFTIAGNTSFYLLIGETYDLPVVFNSATPGVYNDSLVIVNNSINHPSLSVGLDGITIDPPIVGVAPLAVTDSLLSGQSSMHYFDVWNDGASPLYFDISIEDNSKRSATVRVIRNNNTNTSLNYPKGTAAVSFGKAPVKPAGTPSKPSGNYKFGETAFGLDALSDTFLKFNLATPSTAITVSTIAMDLYCGDFAPTGEFYAIDNVTSSLIQVDTTNGVATTVGALTVAAGHTWTGLAYDPSTASWFGLSVDGVSMSLYSIDITTPSATVIGSQSTTPLAIDLAFDNAGVCYTHDLSDNIYLLDVTTAAATLIGSTGFDANFAQGMDVDPATNTLYLAAYNNATSSAELRTVDVTTGLTSVVGPIGAGAGVEVGAFGIAGAGSPDWISTIPEADTVAVGDTVQVAVLFNAAGLNDGWYQADVNVNSNDPVTPMVTVDATLHVTGVSNIAVNPDMLDFGFLFLGVADTMTFAVENPGTADLNVTGMATSTPEFTVLTTTPFTVTPGGSYDVDVVYSAAASGIHTDSVVVTHDAPIVLSDVVQLTGETANPPVLVMGDTLMQHTMNSGEEDSTALWMYNQGASTLDYELMLGDVPFADAASYAGQPVDPNAGYNNKAEIDPAVDPGLTYGVPREAIWDLQFAYDVDTPSGLTGISGAETDGTYLYGTKWSGTGEIVKFDLAGNYIETFTIPGVVNLRDLAYDGTYFYGSDASSYIWQMDFTNKVLVGMITTPASVRAIAYDSDLDGFWYNNFSTDLHFVDRSGTLLNTISTPPSMYGCAYDNFSAGGPYLWIFTGTSTGLGCQVEQYNLATQTLTGVTHSVSGDLGDYIAGGLFLQPNLVSGTVTLGGLAQGTPDLIFGYELTEYANWVSLGHTSGSIAPGDSGSVWVYWHGVDTEELHEGYLGVYSNDPVHPVENVHLMLDVLTGIDEITEAIPTKYALHQNYPNPFNPSTTIKYDLKAKTDVVLTIYNVLGQKVRTLVNTNQAAGYQNVVWDGLNEFGEQVSTGVYIYRIEAGDFVKARKMVFMK